MGTSELLFYGLLVVGFLLFNYVLQRAAKRAQRQQQEQEQESARQQVAAPSPEDEPPPEETWGRKSRAGPRAAAVPVEPVRRVAAALAAARTPPPHRTAPRALFRSRQDLRRAIVVMTVLGPCRALEPYDRPHASTQDTGSPPPRG